MNLLRFLTAGSVDDGKSTLIGRLLYDSKNILVDQLEILQKQSKNKNGNEVDLALLTDGLRAEREQGITIDVAYKYFTTPTRKYIIADAPGHVQYTRNMVTAASTADAIIILIDARLGVIEQTRRHAYIAALMGIKHVLFAVNKMDLVGYDALSFMSIHQQCLELCTKLKISEPVIIPIAALHGDNITDASALMPWYKGLTILDTLEQLNVEQNDSGSASYFQVQLVNRPQTDDLHDFRGYMGSVLSGQFHVGREIQVFPSGLTTTVAAIWEGGNEVSSTQDGGVYTLTLSDDMDVSRGDAFYLDHVEWKVFQEIDARICWFSEKPAKSGMKVRLQQNSTSVRAVISELLDKLDIQALVNIASPEEILLNDIVRVRLKLQRPILLNVKHPFSKVNRAVLIDEVNHSTLAAVIFDVE